jgi:hypothetical protein
VKPYGTTLLAAIALTLVMVSPSTALANQAQRLIVDAGVNLGLWQVQVLLFDTPATDPAMISYATFTFDAVTLLGDLLQPPFQDLDLQSVLDRIARYPEATSQMSAAHRASYVAGIYELLGSRLSILYLSTRGRYAGPTCDSTFLDVGYHLGRAQMALFAGDAMLASSARTMLLQAIGLGLDLVSSVGCGFNTEGAWASLAVERARTFADFQGLTEPIREVALVARQRTDVPDLPATPFVGVIQREIDEPGTWVLRSTIRQCNAGDGGPLTSDDGFHAWAIDGSRMSHWFRYPHPPNPTDSEQHFDIAAPPGSLRPGETVELQLVATGGGTTPHASGEDLEVWTYLGDAQHRALVALREDEAAARITTLGIGFSHGGGVRERTARIPVPAAAATPFTVYVTMAGSDGAVPWGQWGCVIRWVYEAR